MIGQFAKNGACIFSISERTLLIIVQEYVWTLKSLKKYQQSINCVIEALSVHKINKILKLNSDGSTILILRGEILPYSSTSQ